MTLGEKYDIRRESPVYDSYESETGSGATIDRYTGQEYSYTPDPSKPEERETVFVPRGKDLSDALGLV